MKRRSEPKPFYRITVEIDGKFYAGTYTPDRGIMHVNSEFGAGTIEAKSGSEEIWARQKLRELVHQWLSTQG
jgi:hypothetical protein